MPSLTVPANPASPIAAAPAAAGNGADGQAGNLFAALLSQQIGIASASADTGDPASLKTAEAQPAAGDAADLAALLPLFFNIGAGGAATAGGRDKPLADDEQAQANQAELALALLASPIATAANNAPAAGDAQAASGRPAEPRPTAAATASPANVAARLPTAIATTARQDIEPAPANTALPAATNGAAVETQGKAPAPANTALPAAASGGATETQGKADPAPAATLPESAAVPMHAAAAAKPAAGNGELRVAAPVGGNAWATAVGNSVVFMANHQQNRAELVLTPPQLGRIEITLSVSGDQASAVFVSPNPAVRDALESALPRLREVLADAGITLGQAQIDSGSSRQSSPGDGNDGNARRAATADFAAGPSAKAAAAAVDNPWTRTARGLVDVFA